MTTITRYPLVDGRYCLDPGPLREDLTRYGGGHVNFDGLANSVECPRGRQPGNAWFLMSRENAGKLPKNAAITISWVSGATETFDNYWLVKAVAVTPGLKDQAYLVHLQDVRCVLELTAINKRYNQEKPLPFALADSRLAEKFYSDSLNSGALWTWATIFADLWALLPGVAGAAPALPITPASSPRNLAFVGCSVWGAICELLARIGCEPSFNPRTGTFTIINMAAADNAATLSNLSTVRVFDAFALEGINASQSPANIITHFGKVAPTAEPDNPALTYSTASEITGAVAGTNWPAWDAAPAKYCPDQTLNNGAALNSRATELAGYLSGWFAQANTDRIMVFQGVQRLQPTSRIQRIVWRDWGDGEGTLTEVYNGGGMPPSFSAETVEPQRLCRFILTANLNPGSSAAASVLEYVNAAGNWQAGTCPITVYDSANLLSTALPINSKGFAYYHLDSEKWELLSVAANAGTIIRAKVYDDQIGSNSPGYVLFWDESIAGYVSAANKTQIVNRECQQLFKDEIIFVTWNTDEQEYQPVRCEHWVQHGKFTANVAKGDTGTARRWVAGVEVAAVDITVRSRYRAVDKNRWIAFAWDENEWSVIEDEGYKHYRAKVDTIQIDSSASGPVKLFRDGAYDAGTTSVYVMEGHTPGLRNEIVWVTYTPEEDKYYITKTPVQVYRGKAITAITAGSTGTVHRYDRSGTLITDDLTVRSQMGAVEINAELMFAWNGQEWEVVNKECP
ncbi:MAG: hypothetical protein SFX18_13335 [Pirellulales bacterium]|nr:hypothetical protein [Pirellulales bacterium]